MQESIELQKVSIAQQAELKVLLEANSEKLDSLVKEKKKDWGSFRD